MTLAIDRNGWLTSDEKGPRLFYLPTVRTTPLEPRNPLGIVWHTTGGICGHNYAERLVRRIQTYRRGVDRPASFHLVIDRGGAIYQCAPFSVGTWHVGRAGEIAGRSFENINRATIGVELENAGNLHAVKDGFYTWPFYSDPHAPPPERRADPRCRVGRLRATLFSDGRFYDLFPPAQIATATELVRACAQRYRLSRRAAAYGHCDFSSPTKTDPGPLWMRGILPRVLHHAYEAAPPARPATPPEAATS